MIFECRITRSCIYWDDDKREILDFNIEAETIEDLKKKLYDKAMRLEFSTGSKLVQDILIKIKGEYVFYDTIGDENEE